MSEGASDAEPSADSEDPDGLADQPSAKSASPGARRRPGSRHDGYGAIWSLAWPFMLNLVLVNAVGLIDAAMVARLSSEALAAQGYAHQYFFLVQSVLLAVGASCVALMARAIGGGSPEQSRAALAASLEVAGATSLLSAAGLIATPQLWVELLGAGASTAELAAPYLRLLVASSVPMAIAIVLESGLRADRDTLSPLLASALMMAVKTLLNLGLIFGLAGLPRLELLGAGIATLVAQLASLGLLVAVVARAPRSGPLALVRSDRRLAGRLRADVVRIALPGVGERLAMNLALLLYFRILSDYGTLAVAAYSVGIRMLSFSWIPGIAFGVAASTLVGQALGAGRGDAARRAGWRASGLALIVAVVLGAACAVAREPLARLFSDEQALVAELTPFLLALAVVQPFLQSHFALGGAHRGAGDTTTPFVASALGNWALRMPLAALFAWVLELPVVWVWYAIVFDHLTRAAWLTWSFRRGRWAHAIRAGPRAEAAGRRARR